MDEVTLKRCTEPFFTTKEVDKGTGLGLSSVHGLAVQSGGAIHIASRVGVGTTVTLWFPVANIALESGTVADPPVIDHRPESYSILVVDDEALVGHVTAMILEDLGHHPVWVPTAMSALDLLNGYEKVDVIITDHAMPGMTGAALANEIRKRWPNLPIVLATGFADTPAHGSHEFAKLSKPYGPSDLAAVLNSISRQKRVS